MARKRMVDPDIWRDRNVIKLTNSQLIVWIGCISRADDEGLIEPDVDSFYFELARREISVEEIAGAFDRLEELGMIVRYDEYALLPNWYKHQSLDHPRQTKLRRPSRRILEEYPEYVASWERTFGVKDKPAPYPFDTCLPEPAEEDRGLDEDSPNDQQTFDEDSTNTAGTFDERSTNDQRTFAPNGMERNGKERNGILAGPAPKNGKRDSKARASPQAADAARIDPDLKRAIKGSMVSIAEREGEDPRQWNWGKEGKHIEGLAGRALKYPDPWEWVRRLIEAFAELVYHSGEKFWWGLPFTPSTLNSDAICLRVMKVMEGEKGLDVEAIAREEGLQ